MHISSESRKMFVSLALLGLLVFNICLIYSFPVGEFVGSALEDYPKETIGCPKLASYLLSDTMVPLNETFELRAKLVNDTDEVCMVSPQIKFVFIEGEATQLTPDESPINLAPNEEVEFTWALSSNETGYGTLRLSENNRSLISREISVVFTFGLSIDQVRIITKTLEIVSIITLSIGLFGWISLDAKRDDVSSSKKVVSIVTGISCSSGLFLGGIISIVLQTNPLLCGIGNFIWCGALPIIGMLISTLGGLGFSVLFNHRLSLPIVVTIFFEIGLVTGFLLNSIPQVNPWAVLGCL